jgi:hypothetical protein
VSDNDDFVEDLFSPAIARLSADLRLAAQSLGDQEARYLVDAYYAAQENRKRTDNQVRQSGETEPSSILVWLAAQDGTLENRIKTALDIYTSHHVMGSWMREIVGIGPVISAGLLAHIDITKAPTVGHIWQHAGIAGSGQKPWKKGEKRPHNATLKTLCWKAGQSFMKFSNREDCIYGRIYRERKKLEIERNERGEFAETAAARVSTVGKTTEAFKSYSAGKLPPGHIDARARRYAVKLFLADLHGEWHRRHFKAEPPLPYPIAHLNHVHNRAAA